MEQSAKELGQAFAGATTNTEDGSAVFFNPGALGRFSGRQLTVAGHLVSPSIRFHDGGSRLALPVGGAPLAGGDGGDAGHTIFVPNLYYVQELGPRLVFGLGLNAPFGLHTDYDPNWKGRYHSITAELQTVSLRPALALRVGGRLSLGATITAQYAYARLSNAIDFGTLCLASLPPPTCGGLGLAPQRADGRFEVEGDDLAWGYSLGALYAFNNDTRIGVSYRSAIDQSIEGDAEFTVPAAALPLTRGGTLFTNTGARTDSRLAGQRRARGLPPLAPALDSCRGRAMDALEPFQGTAHPVRLSAAGYGEPTAMGGHRTLRLGPELAAEAGSDPADGGRLRRVAGAGPAVPLSARAGQRPFLAGRGRELPGLYQRNHAPRLCPPVRPRPPHRQPEPHRGYTGGQVPTRY